MPQRPTLLPLNLAWACCVLPPSCLGGVLGSFLPADPSLFADTGMHDDEGGRCGGGLGCRFDDGGAGRSVFADLCICIICL